MRPGTSSIAGPLGAALAIAVSVTALFLFVALALVGAGLSIFGRPAVVEEFAVSDPECNEESSDEVLISLVLEPLESSRVIAVQVENVAIEGGTLVGVATLPSGRNVENLSESQRRDLSAQLNQGDTWLDVPSEPQTIVLKFERSADSLLEVSGFDLWIAYGEPAAVQPVPLVTVWERQCVATLRP